MKAWRAAEICLWFPLVSVGVWPQCPRLWTPPKPDYLLVILDCSVIQTNLFPHSFRFKGSLPCQPGTGDWKNQNKQNVWLLIQKNRVLNAHCIFNAASDYEDGPLIALWEFEAHYNEHDSWERHWNLSPPSTAKGCYLKLTLNTHASK